jgi:hypothetical protein
VTGAATMTTIGGLIAVAMTLLVLSRIFGDNMAFRAVQYLFVGISLGYAFVVVYHQVLRPAVLGMLLDTGNPARMTLRIAPFVLGLLLFTRASRHQSISWLANIPLGLIFGIAAALAVAGATAGTLLPQLLDTARPVTSDIQQMIGSILLVIGVVLTLCTFYFTVPRETSGGRIIALGAQAGRWLLMIAFGFFLAGSLLTYLTALDDRLRFVVDFLRSFLS